MNAYIKEHGRTLDVSEHLNDLGQEMDILEELTTYQNMDGGFGHGLELDIQAPISNIPSTNVAASYLYQVKPSKKRDAMIKAMVDYYQDMFYKQDHRWHMVEKEVDQYPRAVWWNYENRASFGLLNPTPEILGFLYQNKKHLTNFPLADEVKRMVIRIKEELGASNSFHDVLSILRFYRDVPSIRKDIEALLQSKIHTFLTEDAEYRLRAHQVYMLASNLIDMGQLKEDIEDLQKELNKKGYIECPWQWFQYEDTFAKIKPLWSAYLTKEAIKAINKYKEEF